MGQPNRAVGYVRVTRPPVYVVPHRIRAIALLSEGADADRENAARGSGVVSERRVFERAILWEMLTHASGMHDVIAEQDGAPIGAAWARILSDADARCAAG